MEDDNCYDAGCDAFVGCTILLITTLINSIKQCFQKD